MALGWKETFRELVGKVCVSQILLAFISSVPRRELSRPYAHFGNSFICPQNKFYWFQFINLLKSMKQTITWEYFTFLLSLGVLQAVKIFLLAPSSGFPHHALCDCTSSLFGRCQMTQNSCTWMYLLFVDPSVCLQVFSRLTLQEKKVGYLCLMELVSERQRNWGSAKVKLWPSRGHFPLSRAHSREESILERVPSTAG